MIRKILAAALALSLVFGAAGLTNTGIFNEQAVITAEAQEDGIAINEANFPDEVFRNYVSEHFDIDSDGYLSDNEIEDITDIYFLETGIKSLRGIEYFSELESLYCMYCELSYLDVSMNTRLTHLYCSGNNLESLDVSNNVALIFLYCDNNNLTEIDVSNNINLRHLGCSNNNLKALDISKNTSIYNLTCENNQITVLDISNHNILIETYNNPEFIIEGDGYKRYNSYGSGGQSYAVGFDNNVNIITGATEPDDNPSPGTPAEDITLTDEYTNISVSATTDVISEETILNVEPLTSNIDHMRYNITLTDADGNEIQPDGEVTVAIPVPADWATDKLYVYREEADGSYTDMNAVYADGYVTFTTDHFSTYTLTTEVLGSDAEVPDDTESDDADTTDDTTSDNTSADGTTTDNSSADSSSNPTTGTTAGLAFAGLALAGAAVIVSKKNK